MPAVMLLLSLLLPLVSASPNPQVNLVKGNVTTTPAAAATSPTLSNITGPSPVLSGTPSVSPSPVVELPDPAVVITKPVEDSVYYLGNDLEIAWTFNNTEFAEAKVTFSLVDNRISTTEPLTPDLGNTTLKNKYFKVTLPTGVFQPGELYAIRARVSPYFDFFSKQFSLLSPPLPQVAQTATAQSNHSNPILGGATGAIGWDNVATFLQNAGVATATKVGSGAARVGGGAMALVGMLVGSVVLVVV
ncbi:hypothetical protein HDU97_000587 [Phlyctochytrium planicorne]|nr:hypothetical protein HDU97_000587 [Phlyctochytrium planicorne]